MRRRGNPPKQFFHSSSRTSTPLSPTSSTSGECSDDESDMHSSESTTPSPASVPIMTMTLPPVQPLTNESQSMSLPRSVYSPHAGLERLNHTAFINGILHPRRSHPSPLYTLFDLYDTFAERNYPLIRAAPLSLKVSVMSLALFYYLLFSWSSHVILLSFYVFVVAAVVTMKSCMDDRGLLSLIPSPRLTSLLTEYSLLELNRMLWTSHGTMDVLSLFVFNLSETEMRIIMDRLPPSYRHFICSRGLVGLLPNSVQRVLYPKRRMSSATSIELLSDNDNDIEARLESVMPVIDRALRRPPPLLSIPSEILERKYDDSHSDAESDMSESEAEVEEAIHAVLPYHTPASNTATITASTSSVGTNNDIDEEEEKIFAEANGRKPLTFFSLVDRSLSSSFSHVFRSWARQSYAALFHSARDSLPSWLTHSSTLSFFAPLAASVGTMHVLASSVRARQALRQSQSVIIDGVIGLSALIALHQLYYHCIEAFSVSKMTRRPSLPSQRGRRRSLSFTDVPPLSRLSVIRLWLLFVADKVRQERGLYGCAMVLIGWLLYLARGRAALMRWAAARKPQLSEAASKAWQP